MPTRAARTQTHDAPPIRPVVYFLLSYISNSFLSPTMLQNTPWAMALLLFLQTQGELVATTPSPAYTQKTYGLYDSVHTYMDALQKTGEIAFNNYNIGQIDSRIPVIQCNTPYQIEIQQQHSYLLRLKARCNQPKTVQVTVPVRLQYFKPVYASTRNIRKGDIFQESDIHLQNVDVYQEQKGFIAEKPLILGKVAKNHLSAQHIIYPALLQEPFGVRKNQDVSIIFSKNNFSVAAKGTALENGAQGDTITVKNRDTGKTFAAVVERPGVVHIRP